MLLRAALGESDSDLGSDDDAAQLEVANSSMNDDGGGFDCETANRREEVVGAGESLPNRFGVAAEQQPSTFAGVAGAGEERQVDVEAEYQTDHTAAYIAAENGGGVKGGEDEGDGSTSTAAEAAGFMGARDQSREDEDAALKEISLEEEVAAASAAGQSREARAVVEAPTSNREAYANEEGEGALAESVGVIHRRKENNSAEVNGGQNAEMRAGMPSAQDEHNEVGSENGSSDRNELLSKQAEISASSESRLERSASLLAQSLLSNGGVEGYSQEDEDVAAAIRLSLETAAEERERSDEPCGTHGEDEHPELDEPATIATGESGGAVLMEGAGDSSAAEVAEAEPVGEPTEAPETDEDALPTRESYQPSPQAAFSGGVVDEDEEDVDLATFERNPAEAEGVENTGGIAGLEHGCSHEGDTGHADEAAALRAEAAAFEAETAQASADEDDISAVATAFELEAARFYSGGGTDAALATEQERYADFPYDNDYRKGYDDGASGQTPVDAVVNSADMEENPRLMVNDADDEQRDASNEHRSTGIFERKSQELSSDDAARQVLSHPSGAGVGEGSAEGESSPAAGSVVVEDTDPTVTNKKMAEELAAAREREDELTARLLNAQELLAERERQLESTNLSMAEIMQGGSRGGGGNGRGRDDNAVKSDALAAAVAEEKAKGEQALTGALAKHRRDIIRLEGLLEAEKANARSATDALKVWERGAEEWQEKEKMLQVQ